MFEFFRFDEIFKGLSSDRLPDFGYLLGLEVQERASPQELEGVQRESVHLELRSMHESCAPHGFSPLISELALIADVRLYGDERREPYFTSAISAFVEPASSISEIYIDALQFMGTEAAGRTQIVPHPGLYATDTALIKADFSEYLATPHEPRSEELRPNESALSIQAIRQDFVLQSPQPGFGLREQVQRFLKRFCSSLKSSEKTSSVWPVFYDALLAIIPFVRPISGSAAIVTEGHEEYRGYPGGALFLILHDNGELADRNSRILELCRSLLWILAESGMRESYARFMVEEHTARSFLSYQITHPLKHRLGALHRLIERLSDLEGDEDFPRVFSRLEKITQNTYRFAELAHILYHSAMMGQRSPMRAEQEAGNLKFCTTESLDLLELLRSVIADQPVGKHQPQPVLRMEEELSACVAPFAPGRDNSEKVRLNDVFYEAVLQESVHNVITHGRRGEFIDLDLQKGVVDGRNALMFTNEVELSRARAPNGETNEKWEVWKSVSPSGLSFVADALALTGSGRLLYKWNCREEGLCLFSLALILEGLE